MKALTTALSLAICAVTAHATDIPATSTSSSTPDPQHEAIAELGSIHTLRAEFTDQIVFDKTFLLLPGADPSIRRQHCEVEYVTGTMVVQDDKFVTNLGVQNALHEPFQKLLFAYNGVCHMELDEMTNELSVHRYSGDDYHRAWLAIPLLAPYWCLVSDQLTHVAPTIVKIHREQPIFDAMAAKGIPVIEEKIHLLQCEMPDVYRGYSDTLWLSDDQLRYPMKIHRTERGVRSLNGVVSDLGAVPIPNATAGTPAIFHYPKTMVVQEYEAGFLIKTNTITISKVEINSPCAGESFTIDPARAIKVVDGDYESRNLSRESLAVPWPSPAPTQQTFLKANP